MVRDNLSTLYGAIDDGALAITLGKQRARRAESIRVSRLEKANARTTREED